MKKKEFKAESKKLLDLMINSIYTNQEIFLRELISNAQDAIDKLRYESLLNKDIKFKKDKAIIKVIADPKTNTLKIIDTGCGMNKDDLEINLGTIAKSGSELFKQNMDEKKKANIIGQFGVGFYSSFMVAKKVEVISKKYNEEQAYIWSSEGIDGYTVEETQKDDIGTEITLYLKDNDDNNKYSDYLDEFTLETIIKKYSDYIPYPIELTYTFNDKTETKVVNSMIPIWKKPKKDVTDEEYTSFYNDKFYDYEKPLRVIKNKVEGMVTFDSLIFIPSHAPYDYYNKSYEKGLQLYSKGVMIMEKCKELVPDYFSFINGIVDSEDLELNISRETLQHNHQIQVIAKAVESKVKKELLDMLKENREDYEKFFKDFGTQLKYGLYSNWNSKDTIEDLLMFKSTKEMKYVTFQEYVDDFKEGQEKIYYACGKDAENIAKLPQVENVMDKGYQVLLFDEYLDEFAIKTLGKFKDKEFQNVLDDSFSLDTEEEKEELKKINEDSKDLFKFMKEKLSSDVTKVRFTNKLKDNPVCLTSEGEISIEMEKTINAMQNPDKVTANKILEINENHPISTKLKTLFEEDKEKLEDYTKVLYELARQTSGLDIEKPNEFATILCDIISK